MTKLTKEQLAEIKKTLAEKNFKYMQSNGVDNFIYAVIHEGIELLGDKINPFVLEGNERTYDYDAVGNETRAAVSIIEQILMDQDIEPAKDATEPEPKEPEPELTKGEIVPKDDKQLYGIVPQYLTDALIDNHPGTIPCLIGMQKTDPNMVMERADGMHYVDIAYMTAALNLATLMNWSFEVLETRTDKVPTWNAKKKEYENKCHISCLGCLTIETTEGKTIQKQQWGSQVLKAKMEMGDAMKAAASDALKKSASMFGIAADVYGGYL